MSKIIINGVDYTKHSLLSFEEPAICNLTIEKIAKALANKDSEFQGLFFSEFAKWVNILCEKNTGLQGELQFMYIADDLSEEAKKMIDAIIYKLKNED